MSKLYSYEHKGYVLQQSDYNWHYMIIDVETSKAVMHCSYTEKLTEEQAIKAIEDYIYLKDYVKRGNKDESGMLGKCN